MKMIQRGLFRVCFQPITMLNICTTCISWEIGSYNTQQCLHINIRTFVTILSRKAQYNFPKMRGGGQRPFVTFPKIHPIWKRAPSLSSMIKISHYWGIHPIGKSVFEKCAFRNAFLGNIFPENMCAYQNEKYKKGEF